MRLLPAFFALVGCLLLASCDPGPRAAGEKAGKPVILATTPWLSDLARNLVGDEAVVEGLMGPGVDPHLYKPTAGDLARIGKADVLLVHGLDLEGKMEEVLKALRSQGKKVVVAADGIPESRLLLSRDSAKKPDPHIWFDPELWSLVARHSAEGIGASLPPLKPTIEPRLADFQARMTTILKEMKAKAEEIPADRRVLITAHDAFGYFGRAFGFEVHGIQGISTASEAGAQDLAKLAGLIAEKKVKAIFAETSVSPATIEALAKAVEARGWKVKLGGSLFSDATGPKGTPEETMEGALRHNMKQVVEALR